MIKKVSITEYEYKNVKVPVSFDGYRIAVMSDLHCNEIGENNSILLNIIYDLDPDAIMFAGDMVNSNAKNMHVTSNFLTTLSYEYPVFVSCGNHELKLGTNPLTEKKYKSYRHYLRKHGVYYLNNKSAYIEKGSERIKIYGLNIGRRYYEKFVKNELSVQTVNRAVGCCEPENLCVMLAHNPDYFKTYASWGADIVLSGHIHGGLVVLPVLGGVVSPSMTLFPHYDSGEYHEYGSTMFLSRGLGSHTLPIRINNDPEIMMITLHSMTGGNNQWLYP